MNHLEAAIAAGGTVVGYKTEHDSDEGMANQMVHDLCAVYPGHGWFVEIKGGIVHVKDMDISTTWGMCLHYTQIKSDAVERKRQVIRAAGEFLERANLRRGRSDGAVVTHLEGVPDKHLVRNGL